MITDTTGFDFGFLLLFPLLYAETHYRFKYFFSLLSQTEPEIIADVPSRIEFGRDLPVLIIIKDAHRYPVTIHEVLVEIDGLEILKKTMAEKVSDPFRELIFKVPSEQLAPGSVKITVHIDYTSGKGKRQCTSDNHLKTSHDPFPVVIASEPFPAFDNCIYGEAHAHTCYTTDQVEFAASPQNTAHLAAAMGLSFFCATDHSYDLDDMPDNYLVNDPQLGKWHAFQKEIKAFNLEHPDFCIIPGEEVTIRSGDGSNVHCLVYNSPTFFPGSGDSAEKWLQTRSQLDIPQLLAEVEDTAAVFAAHPGEPTPVLQKYLINRGTWQPADCMHDRLDGLQCINGAESKIDRRGLDLWIKTLLSGKRSIALAGNDAHGNFARYRQISTPFISMSENYRHLFGKWRTGVYINENNLSVNSIVQNFKSGNCFMTNGPALQFYLVDEDKIVEMGKSCKNADAIHCNLLSTSEFGKLSKLNIFFGDISGYREIKIESIEGINGYSFKHNYKLNQHIENGYLRMETVTEKGYRAFSNPVWINNTD